MFIHRKIARENNLRKNLGEKSAKEMTSGSDDDVNKLATTSSDSQESCEQNVVENLSSDCDNESVNSRKRDWSKRWSRSSSEVPVKKIGLSRSGSCPIPSPKSFEHSPIVSDDDLAHDRLTLAKGDCANLPESPRSSSLPPSPTQRRRSVNRRSAILFKKARSCLLAPTPSEVDVKNKLPEDSPSSVANINEADVCDKLTCSTDLTESKNEEKIKEPVEAEEVEVDHSSKHTDEKYVVFQAQSCI